MFYKQLIKKAQNGAKITVNFKTRELFVNNKKIQVPQDDLGIPHFDDLSNWLSYVEGLYQNYRYSRPTSNSDRQRRKYFSALPAKELVKKCGRFVLGNPISREVAQTALEAFILLSLVDGSFTPEVLFKEKWFYQGKLKHLIIKKDWF